MNIEELILLCEKRLAYLNSLLGTATNSGDVQQIGKVEQEIAGTLETIEKLKSLLS
jgi:hypothetical protein